MRWLELGIEPTSCFSDTAIAVIVTAFAVIDAVDGIFASSIVVAKVVPEVVDPVQNAGLGLAVVPDEV